MKNWIYSWSNFMLAYCMFHICIYFYWLFIHFLTSETILQCSHSLISSCNKVEDVPRFRSNYCFILIALECFFSKIFSVAHFFCKTLSLIIFYVIMMSKLEFLLPIINCKNYRTKWWYVCKVFGKKRLILKIFIKHIIFPKKSMSISRKKKLWEEIRLIFSIRKGTYQVFCEIQNPLLHQTYLLCS